MATKTVNWKMKQRQGTASQWESKNPVLAVGEIGYDTTNKKTKIGDGVTPWVDLDWFATKSKPNFATDSWSVINEYASTGAAADAYKVGDEKVIELSTGTQITLVILGFNHDNKTGGGKAGISIGMKDMLPDYYVWNSNGSNANGWNGSEIRTQTMATLLTQLPADLQAVIKAVDKKASKGGTLTDILTSSDKLWLLSLAEIYSHDAIATSAWGVIKNYATTYNAEGEQYEYWQNAIGDLDPNDNDEALIKYMNGGAGVWWLRSPCVDYGSNAWYVGSGGYAYRDGVAGCLGVSFGFCV